MIWDCNMFIKNYMNFVQSYFLLNREMKMRFIEDGVYEEMFLC